MKIPVLALTALATLGSAVLTAQANPGSAPAPGAAAAATPAPGTKISGTLTCGKATPTAMEVGDQPGHALAVGKTPCKWTKPLDIGGVASKDGVSTAVSDVRGDIAADHGYHVGTMANGDKYYVRFDGQTKSDKGVLQSQMGRWGFSGGTGKLSSLKGGGTYKSTPAPDGGTIVEVTGEYRLQ